MNWWLVYDDRVPLTDDERATWIKIRSHGLTPRELANRQNRSRDAIQAELDNAREKLQSFIDTHDDAAGNGGTAEGVLRP